MSRSYVGAMITITPTSEARDAYHSALFLSTLSDLPRGNGVFDVRMFESRASFRMISLALNDLFSNAIRSEFEQWISKTSP